MIDWLLVSSSAAVEEQIERFFSRGDGDRFRRHRRVDSLGAARELVAGGGVALVVVELSDDGGLDLDQLAGLGAQEPLTPLLVVTDCEDEDFALRIMHSGAQDCLCKADLSSALLVKSARYAAERVRIERELAGERDLLRALMESIPDRIYFKDRDSRFLRVSRALGEFFELDDPSEAAGRTDFDFFSEEHARPAFEDEQEVLRTGQAIVGKIEKETFRDGRVGWAHTTKLPLRDQNGQIVGTCGISREITDLKLLEDRLATERNLLRSVIDHVPDPIFAKNRDGRYVMSNIAHARRIGAESPEFVLGKLARDFLPEESARIFEEAERRVFEGGEPQIEHLERVTLAEGVARWLVTTRVPLEFEAGKVKSLVCIGRDVTTQKKAQEALERANDDLAGAVGKLKRAHADLRSTQLQLIEAEKMKSIGRLAAGVAHEVKNPLATISMGLEFLQSQDYAQAAHPVRARGLGRRGAAGGLGDQGAAGLLRAASVGAQAGEFE